MLWFLFCVASIDEEGSSSSLESGLVQHHQEGSEGEEGGAEEEWEQVGPKNKSTITRQVSSYCGRGEAKCPRMRYFRCPY